MCRSQVSSIAKEVFVEDAEKERGIIFLSGTVSREIVINLFRIFKGTVAWDGFLALLLYLGLKRIRYFFHVLIF